MKELGLHTVELKLHSEVKATIKIKLEAQDQFVKKSIKIVKFDRIPVY